VTPTTRTTLDVCVWTLRNVRTDSFTDGALLARAEAIAESQPSALRLMPVEQRLYALLGVALATARTEAGSPVSVPA
jgi:hypothetical protein